MAWEGGLRPELALKVEHTAPRGGAWDEFIGQVSWAFACPWSGRTHPPPPLREGLSQRR